MALKGKNWKGKELEREDGLGRMDTGTSEKVTMEGGGHPFMEVFFI